MDKGEAGRSKHLEKSQPQGVLPPPSRRQQICDIARHMVQRGGYKGMNYREIAETLGIERAACHYYFPRKTDLGIAVMKEYCELMQERLKSISSNGDDPPHQFDKYVQLYGDIRVANPDEACPAGMLASELTTLPPAIQKEVRYFFEVNEAWLAHLFLDSLTETRAKEMAIYAVSLLQGSLILARLTGDGERLFSAGRWLRSSVWRGDDIDS